jgi:predicted ATP-grasp superfamily ATP-dependent carboligase
MSFGRSEMAACLVPQTLAFLEFWRYRGLASLEFKYQPKDGKYYFIEMNPRLPWYSALFAHAGVNLPYLAYLDLTNGDEFPRSRAPQRDGVYWIAFTNDLASFLRTRRRGPADYLKWIASVARARSHAWWDWRDPWPFLRSVLRLIGLGVLWLRSRLLRSRWPAGRA